MFLGVQVIVMSGQIVGEQIPFSKKERISKNLILIKEDNFSVLIENFSSHF
jgi:hypothetical protein